MSYTDWVKLIETLTHLYNVALTSDNKELVNKVEKQLDEYLNLKWKI